MSIHYNARMTPRMRALIGGRAKPAKRRAISGAAGVSPANVSKWLRRFRNEGMAGLLSVGRFANPTNLGVSPLNNLSRLDSYWSALTPRCWRVTVMKAGLHLGVLHSVRDGDGALCHDLVESLRGLVAETCASALFNRKMLGEDGFILDSGTTRLTREGWAAPDLVLPNRDMPAIANASCGRETGV